MPTLRRTPSPAADEAVPPPSIEADATPTLVAPPLPGIGAKLLLVEFRSGEAVDLHPEVAPLLCQGWRLRSAVPRIVEGEGLKLLVTLAQPGKRRGKKRRAARRLPSSAAQKLS